jgi:4-hydroxyacetophenone monooxygenase
MTRSVSDQRSITMTADDAELRAALEVGNIPTLLLVLRRLTGDPRWLEEPYRPTRAAALNDNDSGGFPPERQAEIREAAFAAIRDWRDGRTTLPEPPSVESLVAELSAAMNEQIPAEYARTMAEEAGFIDREGLTWTHERPAAADDMHVLIIGAGLSGVATAVYLQRLGIAFTIVERKEAVGGVWWENDYPGAGVDTPTHLYSFSFRPRRGWTRYYAKQPEILSYIQETADEFGITEKVRFSTEVTDARWDEGAQRWEVDVRTADGSTEHLSATAVVSCVGFFSKPSIPNFPGMDDFRGPLFHSSQWDHSVDITGKTVAVIGTGATAQQITPSIAGKAGKVLVFQRSPQWVAPNANYLRDVPEGVRLLMEQVPFYASFYRLRLVWQFQDKLLPTLRRDPGWAYPERAVNATNDKHRVFFTEHIDRELGDRTDLRDKVLPTYPPYGKRILMDNDWIATVRRDDVELVADTVVGFDEGHVLTADGERHAADVVVLATGFETRNMLAPMQIRGRSGVELHEVWGAEDAFAYLGMTVPDFPNLFIVSGPNTALGHGGSAIYVNECCIGYITQMLIRMAEDRIGAVEVREDVAKAYNAKVDAEHEQLIWTHPGMTNWYRNAAGRVVTTIPFRGVDFWQMTQHPDLDDYVLTAAQHAR